MPLHVSSTCSKHVEAWNKLIVKQKFCASSWLITEINNRHAQSAKHQKTIWSCFRKLAPQMVWSVPEAAPAVLCTPDDGCKGHPKHVEHFSSKYISAYSCILWQLVQKEISLPKTHITKWILTHELWQITLQSDWAMGRVTKDSWFDFLQQQDTFLLESIQICCHANKEDTSQGIKHNCTSTPSYSFMI